MNACKQASQRVDGAWLVCGSVHVHVHMRFDQPERWKLEDERFGQLRDTDNLLLQTTTKLDRCKRVKTSLHERRIDGHVWHELRCNVAYCGSIYHYRIAHSRQGLGMNACKQASQRVDDAWLLCDRTRFRFQRRVLTKGDRKFGSYVIRICVQPSWRAIRDRLCTA